MREGELLDFSVCVCVYVVGMGSALFGYFYCAFYVVVFKNVNFEKPKRFVILIMNTEKHD